MKLVTQLIAGQDEPLQVFPWPCLSWIRRPRVEIGKFLDSTAFRIDDIIPTGRAGRGFLVEQGSKLGDAGNPGLP